MSETTGAGTMNPPGAAKIGIVGKPVRNVELQARGRRRDPRPRPDHDAPATATCPDATADAYTEDGWFATGDIGEIDADGYVRIVDRKKELIINAAGKNMSPANIESALKSASPLIGQACVIGDGGPTTRR